MKARAYLAGAAIVAASFNPVLTFPAWAAVILVDPVPAPQGPSADTLTAMETQCNALAAAHDTNNGDVWTAEVVAGDIILVSGPTESGSHTIADAIDGTLEGAGTFTPAHIEFVGDPYRNGGSVNMFGMRQSVGGHYSASAYDFEGEFKTTYSYAFSCDIYQAVFHEGETIHVPAEGIYVIAGDFGESEAAVRGNCAAFTAQGDNDPRPDWWGDPFHGGNPENPHCMFVGTPAHDEVTDDTLDDPVLVGNEPGVAIEEEQTDTLTAHEDAGEGFDTGETLLIGQAVVCISPTTSTQTKKGAPGTWVAKNGYSGEKCTTLWYNTGATVGVPNLNDGSHNWVTVPVI